MGSTQSPPQESTFGRYTLLRLLAQGGMGEVFLAKHAGIAGFERQIVIKKILPHLAEDEAFVKRFIDEARLVMSLSHANIVQVFDTGKEEGSYFIAMEYVDGADLRILLKKAAKKNKDLPLNLALYILAEVCSGLDYAHHKVSESGKPLGIVHRDVSPSNVMLSREGAVKLVDFGVAKATSGMNQSLSGSLRGKVRYMSPEQARGDDLDSKSDIFSLGVMAYELLTGNRLFEAETDLKMIDLVRKADIPSLKETHPHLPIPIASLIDACLSTRPEARPSADSVRRDLLGQIHELTSGDGITGKDMGTYASGILEPAKGLFSLDEALGLEIDPGVAQDRNPTATVYPDEGTPMRYQQNEGISSSWPSTEVTAQQAENVRSLTWMVRVLVATVIVLVGINLFFFMESGESLPPMENTSVTNAKSKEAIKTSAVAPDKKDTKEAPNIPAQNDLKPISVANVQPANETTKMLESKRRLPAAETRDETERREVTQEIQGHKVMVTPVPARARLYANGKRLGKGAREVVVTPGEPVRVSAREEGFRSGQITLNEKSPRRVSIKLNPKSLGRLRFRFFPANAKVSLDGKLLDLNGKNLVDTQLPVGKHVIELTELDGSRKVQKTFTIQENQTQQLGTLKL